LVFSTSYRFAQTCAIHCVAFILGRKGGTSSSLTNAAGQTLISTVNGKMVNYKYYPNGLTKSSTPEGGQALTMKYNPQGKRTLLVDPDGGTVRTEYNGWGELTKEVQP